MSPDVTPPSPLRGGIEGGGGAVSTDRADDTPTIFSNARHARSRNINLARRLRRETTPPERRMWGLLHTFESHRFRRQVPFGRYVVDFACHEARLIVELDGNTHYTDEAIAYDEQRTAWLTTLGYRVLRFTNSDIVTNPDGIWTVINSALSSGSMATEPATPPPSPLRGGAGGGGGQVSTEPTSPPPPSFPPLKGEGGDRAAPSVQEKREY